MKRAIFWFVLLIFTFILVELLGQAVYRITKGVFTWEALHRQDNVFNIRAFTELVNDERLVTNRKNFSCYFTKSSVYLRVPESKIKEAWLVKTDSKRFRVGTNEYFGDRPNIVFIGDSVPFGWGLDGRETVPSQFYALLKKTPAHEFGVINAAVPSYSLYQAIKRYEYEINGKFPVKYVVLQIFDPAMQFLIWGKKWDRRMCWTSKDSLAYSRELVKKIDESGSPLRIILERYSSIHRFIYILKVKLQRIEAPSSSLDIADQKAFRQFECEINSELEELYGSLSAQNIPLVIMPINLSDHFLSSAEKDSPGGLDKKLVTIVGVMNEVFKKFASTHKNTYYFDVGAYFESIGKRDLFIENDPCHLSSHGAVRQAEFLLQKSLDNDLL
jgi:hypothetical protein